MNDKMKVRTFDVVDRDGKTLYQPTLCHECAVELLDYLDRGQRLLPHRRLLDYECRECGLNA